MILQREGGGDAFVSGNMLTPKDFPFLYFNSPTESSVSTPRLKMAADLTVNVSEAGGAHGPELSVHMLKVLGFFFFQRCYLSGFVIGGEFWTLFHDSAPVYKTPR